MLHTLLALWMGTASAQTVLNGDFESGNLSLGWAPSGINGGFASYVTQGTQFSAADVTTGLIFPSPTHAANVRSSGPAPTNSVGILTSTPFLVTTNTLAWFQRSERTAVNIELRVLDASGTTTLSSVGVAPSQGSFASQSTSVAAQCGQQVRIQIRQNTLTNGSGWYSLFDDIRLSGGACPGFIDADDDGYCPAGGRDFNDDGDCADVGETGTVGDCNDADPSISPGAFDQPGNNIDEDCTGDYLCYLDADGDGFGNDDAFVVTSVNPQCDAPGESLSIDDCDDLDAAIRPNAVEIVADNVDGDCDGLEACWEDLDLDGFGSTIVVESPGVCDAPGETDAAGDCDDGADATYPGAAEVVGDPIDQDCSGALTCWVDLDGDTWGGSGTVEAATCADPGAAARPDDCDDADPVSYPGATERIGDAVDQDCDGALTCWLDVDEDGFGRTTSTAYAGASCAATGVSPVATDCDDTNAGISPGATDVPANGIDDDCDGRWTCWTDADQDGHGVAQPIVVDDARCPTALGAADDTDDCDDARADVSPSSPDVPGDALDQDCSGDRSCFVDADGDGWGTAELTDAATCDAPGVATRAGDCDDGDGAISPDATEIPGNDVDEDCSGDLSCWIDADGDGVGGDQLTAGAACAGPGVSDATGDCDDARADVRPGLTDLPGDALDQDCSGDLTCWEDADGDGYGGIALIDAATCAAPGAAANDDDCDDGDAGVSPAAQDLPADGVDRNCDGLWTCFLDNDGDGYGRSLAAVSSDPTCTSDGVASNDDDCDDAASDVYPGATEVVGDAIDQDCDLFVTCWADADGDGSGGSSTAIAVACDDAGVAATSGDCDDDDPARAPTLPERCDPAQRDEDCDGRADDADDDALGRATWYGDGDGDGFGAGDATLRCSPAPDQVSLAGDCDDAAPAIFPGATEQCNGVDDDCDQLVDDADPTVEPDQTWWRDADGDRFGDPGLPRAACAPPEGWTTPGTPDCNDEDPTTYPGAEEVVADGLDQSCDGLDACWIDGDADGFGRDETTAAPDCAGPGLADDPTDCDDANAAIYPGAPEGVGTGVDADCSGDLRCYLDADADGYGNAGGVTLTSLNPACAGVGESLTADDCDDEDAAINPAAAEVPGNDIDEDCSGEFTCFADADEDGVGGPVVIPSADAACVSAGEAANTGDCDDDDADRYPGATEVPASGVDADCDGQFLCWLDGDGDGVGNDLGLTTPSGAADCAEIGASVDPTDCDDANATVSPTAAEIPGNGVDDDCDGVDAPLPDDTGDTDAPPDTEDTEDTEDTDAPVETDVPDTDAPDTDLPDTDVPDTDDVDPEGWYSGGCDCDSRGAPGPAGLAALALLAWARRRR